MPSDRYGSLLITLDSGEGGPVLDRTSTSTVHSRVGLGSRRWVPVGFVAGSCRDGSRVRGDRLRPRCGRRTAGRGGVGTRRGCRIHSQGILSGTETPRLKGGVVEHDDDPCGPRTEATVDRSSMARASMVDVKSGMPSGTRQTSCSPRVKPCPTGDRAQKTDPLPAPRQAQNGPLAAFDRIEVAEDGVLEHYGIHCSCWAGAAPTAVWTLRKSTTLRCDRRRLHDERFAEARSGRAPSPAESTLLDQFVVTTVEKPLGRVMANRKIVGAKAGKAELAILILAVHLKAPRRPDAAHRRRHLLDKFEIAKKLPPAPVSREQDVKRGKGKGTSSAGTPLSRPRATISACRRSRKRNPPHDQSRVCHSRG